MSYYPKEARKVDRQRLWEMTFAAYFAAEYSRYGNFNKANAQVWSITDGAIVVADLALENLDKALAEDKEPK